LTPATCVEGKYRWQPGEWSGRERRANGRLKQNRPFCFRRGGDAGARPRRCEPLRASRRPKYLNAAERRRFLKAATQTEPRTQLFCLVLGWSGARISEVLALTPAAIDIDSGVASIETLKRRKRGVVRQVPLPRSLIAQLNRAFDLRRCQRDPDLAVERLWTWSRTTAWRRVKMIIAQAGIAGAHAMPKGLRHGFGVNAFQSNVPPHLVQRWLGHASLDSTAIYGDVVVPDERSFAERMWR
jgi:integrase/recombinase XerD